MGHMNHASGLDILGAILMLGWAIAMWAAVAVLFVGNRKPTVRPWVYKGAVGLIGIGVVGQIGHLQEHIAQAAYWIAHPNAKPWMTPWGDSLARGFGQINTAKPSLGMEILHLVGNFIFLAGIAGVALITARARQTRAHKWGKMGVWMQGIHGVEHVVLTVSIALGATRAVGLSTWFGALSVGPGLWTYRIWWHSLANLVGSVVFAMAVYRLWQERATIRATFQSTDADVNVIKEPVLVPMNRPVADAGAI